MTEADLEAAPDDGLAAAAEELIIMLVEGAAEEGTERVTPAEEQSCWAKARASVDGCQ